MTPSIEELCLTRDAVLLDALKRIDKTAQGFLFVTENTKKLIGVLTDGDIRRGLLKGLTLQTPVEELIKENPVTLHYSAGTDEIQKTLSDVIWFIPLIDEKGCIVDYATKSHFHTYPVAEPAFKGNEASYLQECIETGWISSQGRFVREFEARLAEYHGLNKGNVLSASNGTTALHLAMATLGIGEGDEVIVPNLTFAASINAVLYVGATPVLVDISEGSWTMDVTALEQAVNSKTKAILPVHLYGHPCDMTAIMQCAQRHNLLVIEDCAQAIGARWQGQLVGTFGDAACYSFFGNKILTTGEGGAVFFKENDIAFRASILRDHGMDKEKRYWHNEVGYNYRMTNLQAAVGVAQLEQITEILVKKQSIEKIYDENLVNCASLQKICPHENSETVCWLYTTVVDEECGLKREELIDRLLRVGVDARPVFYPLHEMPPYQSYTNGKTFPVSTKISQSGLSFPSSINLQEDDIADICSKIEKVISTRNLLNSSPK